ncbi:MAG TPA: AbrB/MazE/SpoVT family DNA-binding domain-containing protein [Candidatus Obscuribacterales bacterium]
MKRVKTAKAVVAERGQVTIPKVIRDKLGIRPGVVLSFELRDNTIIVSKDLTSDPIGSIYGCLKGATSYSSTDEYMTEIRGAAE